MGEQADFLSFCDNLTIKNLDVIRQRYRTVTRQLNVDYWGSTSYTEHSIYGGSFGRGTAIDGSSDVDFYMRLPDSVFQRFNSYFGNGQSALLQSVKESLREVYPRTDLKGDGQVVVVRFTDNLRLEVVPVFNTLKSPDYTYADSNNGGTWRYCYPKDEQRAFSTANQACRGNLIRLCRMMRAWRRNCSVPMSGILIDKLAADWLVSSSYTTSGYLYYDRMCRDFFYHLSNQWPYQTEWPPLGNGYSIARSGPFENKAKRAYGIAATACDYGTENAMVQATARGKWREIFGGFFPR